MKRLVAAVVVATLAGVTVGSLLTNGASPESWALACACIWAGFLVSRGGWAGMGHLPFPGTGSRLRMLLQAGPAPRVALHAAMSM